MDIKNRIAYRIAQDLQTGDVINLGIGAPTLVANHVPEGIEVFFEAENGALGAGPTPEVPDKDIVNAGGAPISVIPGGCFFDSSKSFALIRGGHVDMTVLGALQVDQEGNLANWLVPGKRVSGMGGAMDLVVGAKKVIIAMEHTAKGNPKIFEKCSFPLTAVKCVSRIVTEMGVIDVTPEGLVLREIAPEFTPEQVQAATAAKLTIAEDIKTMAVGEF